MNDAVDDPRPIDVHDPDKGPESPDGGKPPDPTKPLTIRIDRKEYRVPPELLDDGKLTGQQIRRLARRTSVQIAIYLRSYPAVPTVRSTPQKGS